MLESDLLNKISKIKTNNDLLEVLNLEPPKDWVVLHSEIQNYYYLPYKRVLQLLRLIFKFNFKIEVIEAKELLKNTASNIRLWYKVPESDEWLFLDGLGADLPKANTELEMKYSVAASLPKSKSNGVKNASLGLGKLFGSDLNRNDTIVKDINPNDKKLNQLIELYNEKKEKIPFDDQLFYDDVIEKKESIDYDKLIKELKNIK